MDSKEPSTHIDFHNFHLRELPARLAAGNGLRAAIAARELPALCFRIANTDNAYTYRPGPETIHIIAGTEAKNIIEVDYSVWQQLVCGQIEVSSVYCRDHAAARDDDALDVQGWQSVLRAMFDE
jgi:hypothetical protein